MKLAVFASGAGSTFEYLLKHQQSDQKCNFKVELLLVDNPAAKAISFAKDYLVPFSIVSQNDFESFEKWDEEVLNKVKSFKVDAIVLAGFLKKIGPQVLNLYENKIINTHPSLLPKFGGRGMYGTKVHQAVLKAGENETGVTIHIVNDKYDQGRVLKQVVVSIFPYDTVDTLQERVKKIEKETLLDFLESWLLPI
jgi:phosphoribosylglycinamide formyltransferase-1